jgi:Tfp pilus assembly protein PilW
MKNKGFTLIELLLYVGTVALLLIALVGVLSFLYSSRVKNQTIAEVEQQGLQAMQIMTQTIRNATSISSPASGSNGASLTLGVVDASKSPTIFDVSSGVLRIKEGAGSAVNLTNSRVSVTSIDFHNLNASVKITFTVSYVNPNNRNEYIFSQNFYATANVRPN